MKKMYAQNYQGSLVDAYDQYMAEQGQAVASTPEEKQQGLTGAPPGSSMHFEGDMGGKTMVGTDRDLALTQEDASGNIIDTTTLHRGETQQMSPFAENVTETPMGPQFAQEGGEILPLADRIKNYRWTGRNG